MNKFTDAARRKADKAAKGPANENELARGIYDQLRQHLSAGLTDLQVQLDYERNVVRLYKPDTVRQLQIICLAEGMFHLDERSSGFQRVVTYNLPRTYRTNEPISEEKMIDEVLIWLQ